MSFVEYDVPIMMGQSEFLIRRTSVDDSDLVIAQARAKLLFETDTQSTSSASSSSSSSSSSSVSSCDSLSVQDELDFDNSTNCLNNDDDHSLDGNSFIPSGSMANNDDESMVVLNYEKNQDIFCDPNTKRVRFATDKDGMIVCVKHEYDCPIEIKDKKKIWYKKSAFQRFRIQCQTDADQARNTNYAKTYLNMYDACGSYEQFRELPQKKSILISESKYRGCESAVFYYKLIDERKRIISTILDLHDQHQRCKNLITAEESIDALSKCSTSLSKRSRRIAHMIGTGDAVVARQIHGLPSDDDNNIATTSIERSSSTQSIASSVIRFLSPTKKSPRRKISSKSELKKLKTNFIMANMPNLHESDNNNNNKNHNNSDLNSASSSALLEI